jgi:hypothetical protein
MLESLALLLKHAFRRSQADRYVVREVYKRLIRGKRHTVLGNQVKDEAATRREAADFLTVLRRFGMKKTDRCIEIGCGSLWAAEPVIGFLQPDSFLGLDVTDLFFNEGRQRLQAALLSEKRPAFEVISRDSVARGFEFQPQFIFSRKTLVHVAPSDLPAFLRQACAMMNRETTCVHETPGRAIRTYRFNKYSWIHSFSDVRDALPADVRLEYRDGAFLVRHPAFQRA